MRVALVGYGQWGRNIGRVLKELGVLSAVVDNHPIGRARVLGDLPMQAFESLSAEVLDSCDAVAIATPSESHFEAAMQAISSGKHVFVEKPLATTWPECSALVERARDKGLALCVGHLMLFHEGYRSVRRLAKDGHLGDLLGAMSMRFGAGRVRSEGVLLSFAPHDVAMLLDILGSVPDTVSASGLSVGGIVYDAVFDCKLGSVNAHAHVSWVLEEKCRLLTVAGTEGMASFDELAGTVGRRGTLHEPALHGLAAVESTIVPHTGESEPLLREIRAFLDFAVAGGPSAPRDLWPPHNAERALDVMRVLFAAERSMDTHGPVPVLER